jgi:hypothetical protein
LNFLLQLELLYGDALSKQDLDGNITHSSGADIQETNFLATTDDLPMNESYSTLPSHENEGHTRALKARRAAPTDCRNPYFEESLKNRDPKHPRIDRLQEQRVSYIFQGLF